MSELVNKMQEKMEEIGTKVLDNLKLPDAVNEYVEHQKRAHAAAESIRDGVGDRHLAFVPVWNELVGAGDAALWMLTYGEVYSKTGIPAEALNAMHLSLEYAPDEDGYRLKFRKTADVLTDSGRLEERYYAVALVGVEEEWWDVDELADLPKRRKDVLEAIEAAGTMESVDDMIQQMFGLGDDDGEPEATLA